MTTNNRMIPEDILQMPGVNLNVSKKNMLELVTLAKSYHPICLLPICVPHLYSTMSTKCNPNLTDFKITIIPPKEMQAIWTEKNDLPQESPTLDLTHHIQSRNLFPLLPFN